METVMSIAESFGKSGFAKFINSPAGRIARLVVGMALFVWGYTLLVSVIGIFLIIIGLIPLVAGSFDLCLVSALLGGPVSGEKVRELKK
jgi:xanthine/uracil/vitamin C permease (AzgA family)